MIIDFKIDDVTKIFIKYLYSKRQEIQFGLLSSIMNLKHLYKKIMNPQDLLYAGIFNLKP